MNLKFLKNIKSRFWQQVQKSNDCWIWMGAKCSYGYGNFRIMINRTRHVEKAHRASYMLSNNTEIPQGMCICHKCDNRPCVNPDHLFLGSYADNSADMVKKGRSARGQKIGICVLTEEKVKQIIAMKSQYSTTQIAKMFGVSRGCIWNIFRKNSWRYIWTTLS